MILLVQLFINMASGDPLVRVLQGRGLRHVQVEIKEGTPKQSKLLEIGNFFKFSGQKRTFSLQNSENELIKVSTEGEVILTKEVDYEEICRNQNGLCKFDSKVSLIFSE